MIPFAQFNSCYFVKKNLRTYKDLIRKQRWSSKTIKMSSVKVIKASLNGVTAGSGDGPTNGVFPRGRQAVAEMLSCGYVKLHGKNTWQSKIRQGLKGKIPRGSHRIH